MVCYGIFWSGQLARGCEKRDNEVLQRDFVFP